MEHLLRIVLMVDASRAYGRGICRGVANFADHQNNWLILPHERPELDRLPSWIKDSRIDGIIAYIPNQKLHRLITNLGVCAVDVHGRCRSRLIPTIESDAQGIVDLAIQFFIKSGFLHLGFCGFPGVFFSEQRKEAFRAQTRKLKLNAHFYSTQVDSKQLGSDLYQFEKSSMVQEPSLSAWLRSLPKPAAVLACNDIRGQQIISLCREEGIRIPEEVAVLGVDNDEMICRLCSPTLSTIEPDVERIGFLAAELLAAQLQGKTVGLNYQISPRRVIERKSTDIVVAEHPLVVSAARLIRDQTCIEDSVEQICEKLGTSRSTLDKLFLSNLGRSISGEITRIRLQRSRNLLLNTSSSLTEIAHKCGFSSATYFCRFFKQKTGQTPNSYRQG